MNYILFLLLFVTSLSTVAAHPPKKIYSITRQNFSADYYFQQAALWKQELEQDKNNSTAWFNYLMAHQVLLEKGSIEKAQLVPIQQAISKVLPQSFEAYFAQYLVEKEPKVLLQAYNSAPDRSETYGYLMDHYITTFQEEQAKQLSQQWLASGAYSNGLLHWNYNALIGLEQQALLLTEGANYTQPLWLLQYGKGVRPDVQVLSLEALCQPSYRKQIFEQLGLPALVSNERPAIVQHLSQYSNKHALYLGLSVSKQLTQNQEEELYLIGLAFRHSNQSFDNLEVLVDNYEQHFLLDYLKTDLNYDISQGLVEQANVNYLPAFLLLYDYYQEKDAWSKANEIKQLSLKIADAAEKGEEARAYLDKRFNVEKGKTMVEISAKEIEDQFRPLPYSVNLYASEGEVSNASYELFLTDLIRHKEFEQVQQHQIYKTDWRSYLPKEHQDIEEKLLFNLGAPNDPKHPIQNISYESAVAYCAWLTAVYNNMEEGKGNKGKKKYKNVRFRLPTAAEWEAAALGKSLHTPTEAYKNGAEFAYTWRGDFYKNSKGCFLANFNTNDEPPCKECEEQKGPPRDGAFFTVPVNTYFPNDWGMFNMIGNVAEMVQEKGKAKGGSWFHTPQNSTVQSVQAYNQPAPYIGFRVFMEVLQENLQEKVKRGNNGPPATFHLKGNLYFDATEISNISWKEYVDWNKRKVLEAYSASLPDTTVWLSTGEALQPFVSNYYQNASYDNYPVVGISHQQATAYCKWRSDRVNEMLAANPNSQKKFGTVVYRLPTATEWEYAASTGFDKNIFPHGAPALNDENGPTIANLRFEEAETSSSKVLSITSPVNSYMYNSKGYYNMIGNVAEMIEEEGVSKGGSWQHSPEQSKIVQQVPYEGPKSWLGFRCICEIYH